MKTVALLFFAFELVYTAPTQDEHHLLKRIMDTVNDLLKTGPEEFLSSIVPHQFDRERCGRKGPEDFCIAEKILTDINYTKYGIPENREIHRFLIQYNKFHPNNCTVDKDEEEEQLRALLEDLYCCAQVKYSRRNHKRTVCFHNNTPLTMT
uniref:Interleukin n=1 Tax=Esox lucius TaxID=8010 RepID=A0AAY5K8E9_ESOLU